MSPVGQTSGDDIYGVTGRSEWLDVDWPAHQRWLEIDNRAVNVIDIGSGPPLLFVHGLSGCWQNWLENLPHFARTHRVIAPDLPGFGASEMPRETISISGYARLLDRLMQQLGIDSAAVVGNSMGGFVSAELAIAEPGRVERLMLVSPAGISAEKVRREPVLAVGHAMAAMAAWSVSRHEKLARRAGMRRLALSFVVRHPDRLSAPLAHELLQGSGKPGFMPALAANLGYPIRERLAQIACPTFVIWGENDRVIPVRDAHEFERQIPNARKLILADTGHVAMLERPARFNALLDDFLAEGPSEPVHAPAPVVSA